MHNFPSDASTGQAASDSAKDAVEFYRIGGGEDLQVELTNAGAAVSALRISATDGPLDIAHSCPAAAAWPDNINYCGSTVGRFANRIGNGRLPLDGKIHVLARNDSAGRHCLHGGVDGFHRKLWRAEPIDGNGGVRFSRTSTDGEEGFPGTVDVTVEYRVRGAELRIDYLARTDRPTVVSLTNHSYFNLDGIVDGVPSNLDSHIVTVNAERYTPTDADGIPTGEIATVEGTPLNLREETAIAENLRLIPDALRNFGGYDHNFALNDRNIATTTVASARSFRTGIGLELLTSLPGLQFYTANAAQLPLTRHCGFCFEPQFFPDSPNQPDFPSALLAPPDEYRHFISYRFSRS